MAEPQSPASTPDLLGAIARGVEAHIGDAFFSALVSSLAQALAVPYTFVSEITQGGSHFRTLALWQRGEHAPNVEIALEGTPCQAVLGGEAVLHPDRLQELFPRDAVLADWSARSYGGVPLLDTAGGVLGHFAFVHDAPWRDGPTALATMRIYARRAAAEIERQRLHQALEHAEAQLAGIIDAATDAILSFDEAGRIVLANPAAERALGCGRAALLGTPVRRFATPEGLPALEAAIERLSAQPSARLFVGEQDGQRARRADGTTFPFESSISRSDASGRPLFTMILRDLDQRHEEERELRRLRSQTEYLREELAAAHPFQEIVGRSTALRKLVEQLDLVAPTGATVLIQGETGVGKELAARALHDRSPRSDKPLIVVNCAAIPAGLVESELFGHEKGAFTGATERRIGRFELARGGTLFLDEIGELPLEAQAKLLRVLQEHEFERVGGRVTLQADARVIAATNRNLQRAVAEGRFREDLYYRLAVFPLVLPPLRERVEDIPLLAEFFLARHAPRIGRRATRLAPGALERLAAYPFPGNVRELENLIERALILLPPDQSELGSDTVARVLGAAAPAPPQATPGANGPPPADLRSNGGAAATLDDVERRHIEACLLASGGRIEGPDGAAHRLGLAPSTLRSLMKRLGISRSP